MKKRIKSLFGKTKTSLIEPKVQWKFDSFDERRFFFMHIPKTAGTTFRRILERHSPEQYLWPDQKFLSTNNNKYPKQKELLKDYRSHLESNILLGHYNFDLIKQLSKNVIILTFLRNPYERVLSHIKHICALDKKYGGDPNLVIEENFKQLLHVQSRMLRFQPFNQIGFQNMKTNIARIDFIGLTEEFEKSIQLCNKMFNWKLEMIEAQNQRPIEALGALSEVNKSKIINELIPEIKAYKLARKKFNNLCKELGI